MYCAALLCRDPNLRTLKRSAEDLSKSLSRRLPILELTAATVGLDKEEPLLRELTSEAIEEPPLISLREPLERSGLVSPGAQTPPIGYAMMGWHVDDSIANACCVGWELGAQTKANKAGCNKTASAVFGSAWTSSALSRGPSFLVAAIAL